jgi:hypothetical protein
MLKHAALALAFTILGLIPQCDGTKETKVVILLETGEAAPIQCDGYPKGKQQCLDISKARSDELRSAVNVEMRIDPDCAGMGIATSMGEMSNFGSYTNGETDYINATVGYYPTTNQNGWWLNIVKINGKQGPDYMSGVASNAKEIAHKLCYIIHQEKITRR